MMGRPGANRSPKRLAVLLAAVQLVTAQVAFYSSTPGTYLSYCTAAGTGEVLTPRCSGSYDQAVSVVKLLIGDEEDAYHFNETDLMELEDLCLSSTEASPGPRHSDSLLGQCWAGVLALDWPNTAIALAASAG